VSAQSDAEWDRDVRELGERAAWWQLQDELGGIYPRLEDRARSVVAGCYAKVAEGCPEEAPLWYPALDEHGRWVMPGKPAGGGGPPC
jgi:hypothetical protein